VTVTSSLKASRRSVRSLVALVVTTRTPELPASCAMLVARIALAWIFIYYGAGKLFGAFNGPGIHRTALYFSDTAHLHPGGFFAVLGGIVEFSSAIALALGLASRLAGLALFGDMVLAMITVTWATGINSTSSPPGYQLNLALAALSLVVAALGSGQFSVDALIERRIGGAAPFGETGSLLGAFHTGASDLVQKQGAVSSAERVSVGDIPQGVVGRHTKAR
jgi:putative oxidoreductase